MILDDENLEKEYEDKLQKMALDKIEDAAECIAKAIRESKSEIDLKEILKPLQSLKPQDLSGISSQIKSGYELLAKEIQRKDDGFAKMETLTNHLIAELKVLSQERKTLIETISKISKSDYKEELKELTEALKRGEEEWVFQISRSKFNQEMESIKATKIK